MECERHTRPLFFLACLRLTTPYAYPWQAALVEVVKQVHVHCNERGQLLEAIRVHYTETMEMLLHGPRPRRRRRRRARSSWRSLRTSTVLRLR